MIIYTDQSLWSLDKVLALRKDVDYIHVAPSYGKTWSVTDHEQLFKLPYIIYCIVHSLPFPQSLFASSLLWHSRDPKARPQKWKQLCERRPWWWWYMAAIMHSFMWPLCPLITLCHHIQIVAGGGRGRGRALVLLLTTWNLLAKLWDDMCTKTYVKIIPWKIYIQTPFVSNLSSCTLIYIHIKWYF